MTLTRTINMPLARARTMAQAILPHVGTDTVTPVLTVANVSGGFVTGTDRYSVGRYRLQEGTAEPAANEREAWESRVEVRLWQDGERVEEFTEDFFIPRGALVMLAGLNKRSMLRDEFMARVGLTLSGSVKPGTMDRLRLLTVSILERGIRDSELTETSSRVFEAPAGNYPPVGRLIEQWEPYDGTGDVRFSLMPANISKITRFAGRYDPIIMEAGKATGGKRHNLAPMRVTIGDDFVGLLQPNIIP